MPDLQIDSQNGVTILTLNRPEKHNALTPAMVSELTEAIAAFNADPAQRVAVITGAGGVAFCSGFDLKGMAESAAGGKALPMSEAPDIGGIAASEKPVIGAVNGFAVAGGTEALLCCDIRIAVETAWFGLFEPSRGILAGVAVNLLPRMIPFGAAADLMLTGGRMSAAEAHSLGLIQQVTSPERLLDAALEKAEAIKRMSPSAVWGTKKVLRFWRDALLAEQQRYYEAINHRVLLSGDMHEGPRAFLEKRAPRFSDGWPDPFDRTQAGKS